MQRPSMKYGVGVMIVSLAFFLSYFWSRYRTAPPTSSSSNYVTPQTTQDLSFQIIDQTQRAGISFKHETFPMPPDFKQVEPWFNSLGASVAVADVNNDGWQDILWNSSKIQGQSKLFLNLQNGRFQEATEEFGLQAINQKFPILSTMFVDCDNDGWQDLVLGTWCTQVYRNNKGKFENITASAFSGKCFHTDVSRNALDYDGDGDIDLILGQYFDEYATDNANLNKVMPSSMKYSSNNAKVYLFKNDGNCKFEVDTENQLASRGWHLAIGAYRLRNKKEPDIWLAQDFGFDAVYFNNNGKFTDVSDKVKVNSLSRNGMSVDFADLDNTGETVAYTSHIFEPREKTKGNILWQWKKNGVFKDISDSRGVAECGWSWGNSFIDLNLDGSLDLVVANGYISKDPQKSYWFKVATLDSTNQANTRNGAMWPPMEDHSLSGYQRDCIFLNDGNGNFENVVAATEFDKDMLDGRGVARIDYLNNGSVGIAVANQVSQAKLYLVKQKEKPNWVGFSLSGTKSNRSAWGAVVRVKLASGVELRRELQTLNTFGGQSESRLQFGLGRHAQVERVSIDWPSGCSQVLAQQDFQINHYNSIRENCDSSTSPSL